MQPQPGSRQWVTTLLMHALVLLLVYLVYLVLSPFLVPLAWASVLVIFCHPWHARLPKRWNRSFAAAVSTTLVTAVLIVPAVFIASAFISEAGRAIDAVEQGMAAAQSASAMRFIESLQHFVPAGIVLDVKALAGRALEETGAWLAARVGTILESTAIFAFDLVVTIFAAFFLFRDSRVVMRGLRNALPLGEALRERLLIQIRDVVTAAVTSSFIVASTQGFLGGLAFWLLGFSASVFWGVVMAVFCLLPLGAWVVWLPAAVWLMVTGSPGKGVLLIAIGAGVVSAVDNVLRPLLLSGRTRMNGLLMFISLFGGIAAFGALGLMLGPVVMATGLALFQTYSASVEKARAADGVP